MLKYCVNCFMMKKFIVVLYYVICEMYLGFLGKRNGWNLKICKFVIFKLFFMEGVEIMLWLINCLKCVRKVEWVVLVGVDLERMVLLIMWVFGRDFCLLLVRVWGSLMFVEKCRDIGYRILEVIKDKLGSFELKMWKLDL